MHQLLLVPFFHLCNVSFLWGHRLLSARKGVGISSAIELLDEFSQTLYVETL